MKTKLKKKELDQLKEKIKTIILQDLEKNKASIKFIDITINEYFEKDNTILFYSEISLTRENEMFENSNNNNYFFKRHKFYNILKIYLLTEKHINIKIVCRFNKNFQNIIIN